MQVKTCEVFFCIHQIYFKVFLRKLSYFNSFLSCLLLDELIVLQSIHWNIGCKIVLLFLVYSFNNHTISYATALPEELNKRKIYSLLEVTKSIQKTLQDRYSSAFWVKAEMNKLNFYKQSGHCYPELVEKQDGKIIAQLKSYLWKKDYLHANANFLKVLKEPLKDGIKILFQAKITFDPSHGISLWITDIDPSFTLGDLEREKQETITQLKTEGIFDKNKMLSFPLLPQRIAIISVESSKGYADFLKVLSSNSWNYKFFHFLFPSLLQGEKAVPGIIAQLKNIKKVKQHFDVVAIIRGGGGDVGLSCYNSYALAKAIADFPLPVLTGIGHATNETVTEMVSFSNAITPTKLAEYILQKFHNFSVPVQNAQNKISDKSQRMLSEEKAKFQAEVKLLRSLTENVLNTHHNELQSSTKTLHNYSKFIFQTGNKATSNVENSIGKCTLSYIQNKNLELNHLEKNLAMLHPNNVLKRGYSIARINGKAIKSYKEVKAGDVIVTSLLEGSLNSKIISTKNK